MIKKILIYNLIAFILGVLLCVIHTFLLQLTHHQITFSLIGIYSFFTISSMLIITGLLYMSEYMQNTVGYAFLVGIFLKMGIFVLIFFAGGLADKQLNMLEKVSILIPLIVFMALETSVIIKRLKF